jgi:methyltransferase (TIGR00027 family)
MSDFRSAEHTRIQRTRENMKLPNLSYMMKVGQLRYIQSVYERGEFRNPDLAVRDFLSITQRWACDLRGLLVLEKLRSQPFYYYVLARTKYYDDVFVDGLCRGVGAIVNIGCGSDTRAYRLAHILKQRGIRVLECDQAEAIHTKQELVSRLWPTDHVQYLALDLNEPSLPALEDWLNKTPGTTLVMLEGVSPYVNEDAFGGFLDTLASRLRPGSQVAYDFKLPDVAEGFGLSERTHRPFRLAGDAETVTAFHERHGFKVEHWELGAELTTRLVPDLAGSSRALFREDGLVRLVLP